MPDIRSSARLDPVARPGTSAPSQLNGYSEPATPTDPSIVMPEGQLAPEPAKAAKPARTAERAGTDQLARIEDKTARIEENFVRSEVRMQRVVDKVDAAMERMHGIAQQSDLAAVRGEVAFVARRVRNLPGLPSIILVSVITAILTAGAMLLLLRYAPGLLPR